MIKKTQCSFINVFLHIFILFLVLFAGFFYFSLENVKAGECVASGGGANGCNQHFSFPLGDSHCVGAQPVWDAGATAIVGSCVLGGGMELDLGTTLFDPTCDNSANNETCDTGKCPTAGFGVANNADCMVYFNPLGFDNASCALNANLVKKIGKWNSAKSECVGCAASNKGTVYGNSTMLDYNTGIPTFVFMKFCGADTACDGKNATDPAIVGAACESLGGNAVAGYTCDSQGKCVSAAALSLTAAASPISIALSGSSTITFTVKKSGNPVSGATVNGISVSGGGSVSSGSCTTNASGECTVTYDAPAVSTTATISATKATKVGETDSGSTSTIVTVTTCSAGTMTKFTSSTYTVGDNFNIQWAIAPAEPVNDYVVCLYDNTASNVWDTVVAHVCSGPGCGNIGSDNSQVASAAGTWTVSLSVGVSCPGAPTGCIDSVSVTAACGAPASCSGCADGTPCTGGTCSGGVCVGGGSPSIVSCTGCGGAGSYCDVRIGNSYAGGCTNLIFNDICNPVITSPCNTCTVNLSDATVCDCSTYAICSGGPCAPNTCSGNNVCNTVSGNYEPCPTVGDVCTGAGVCGPPSSSVSSCSGPGMFVSPLGPGYCTIGEILTNATNWILSLVASIIILIIVIGGLMYISAGADEQKLRTSKYVIYYAMVGLGIILISYALITEVVDLLK